MRIVFFVSERVDSNEVFSYMFARVADLFPDTHVVAVCPPPQGSFGRYLRKLKRVWRFGTGVANVLELASSYPLQRYFLDRNEREAQAKIRELPRPPVRPRPEATIRVETVNGPDAVRAISDLDPDVIVQVDAGILRPRIFGIPRIGTLNLHPGIAPLIRGRDPIYWALWEQQPAWMGATVHFIDEGIDTGPVLAYAPIEPRFPGERYPDLFARVYEKGVEGLIYSLARLARGERWKIGPPRGQSVYRSTISGWRLCLIEVRDALRRRRPGRRTAGTPRMGEHP